MRPGLVAFMIGATAWIVRIGSVRFTAMILSHTSCVKVVEVGETGSTCCRRRR